MQLWTIEDIREDFSSLYDEGIFAIDKSGVRTLELLGESIILFSPKDPSHSDSIFGEVNWDYVNREIEWYESQSLRVDNIPGGPPAIWTKVASTKGEINSNYGYLVYSDGNGSQYDNVLEELQRNPWSRRAIMIYTRPSMHADHCRDGMSDFCCTNSVQYLVRDGRLIALVNMRSNDAVFGFKNDYQWQLYVQKKLAEDLGVEVGYMQWNVGSLHVYERHFYLVHHYAETGEHTITKEGFRELYPNFEFEV